MCTFVLYFRFFEKKKLMSCFFYVCFEQPSSVPLENFEVDEEYDDAFVAELDRSVKNATEMLLHLSVSFYSLSFFYCHTYFFIFVLSFMFLPVLLYYCLFLCF